MGPNVCSTDVCSEEGDDCEEEREVDTSLFMQRGQDGRTQFEFDL